MDDHAYRGDLFVSNLPQPRYRWWLSDNVYFTSVEQPNRFHRWMQRVMLGIKWSEL